MTETNIPGSDEAITKLVDERFELQEQGIDTNTLLGLLADLISSRLGSEVTVVSLIGGAASGKTVLSSKLAEQLTVRGLKADVISTDDFVVGDRDYRRVHFEGKDPRAKYDFVLLNKKIDEIRSNHAPGTTIGVPSYDQHSGKAIEAGEANFTHQIGLIDVLVVEGDFFEVKDPDVTIFLDVGADTRLKNRVERDLVHRNVSDEKNVIANFALRQETQHVPYTIPAAESAEILIRGDNPNNQWQYDLYLRNTEK